MSDLLRPEECDALARASEPCQADMLGQTPSGPTADDRPEAPTPAVSDHGTAETPVDDDPLNQAEGKGASGTILVAGRDVRRAWRMKTTAACLSVGLWTATLCGCLALNVKGVWRAAIRRPNNLIAGSMECPAKEDARKKRRLPPSWQPPETNHGA